MNAETKYWWSLCVYESSVCEIQILLVKEMKMTENQL